MIIIFIYYYIITTGFQIGSVDLSNIFVPYSIAATASDTGFTVGGVDLSNIFLPLQTPTTITTKYTGKNGKDIGSIFQSIKYMSNNYYYSFGSSSLWTIIKNDLLAFYTTGINTYITDTITFYVPVTIYAWAVGSGGAGSPGGDSTTGTVSGGGGGGGGLVYDSFYLPKGGKVKVGSAGYSSTLDAKSPSCVKSDDTSDGSKEIYGSAGVTAYYSTGGAGGFALIYINGIPTKPSKNGQGGGGGGGAGTYGGTAAQGGVGNGEPGASDNSTAGADTYGGASDGGNGGNSNNTGYNQIYPGSYLLGSGGGGGGGSYNLNSGSGGSGSTSSGYGAAGGVENGNTDGLHFAGGDASYAFNTTTSSATLLFGGGGGGSVQNAGYYFYPDVHQGGKGAPGVVIMRLVF